MRTLLFILLGVVIGGAGIVLFRPYLGMNALANTSKSYIPNILKPTPVYTGASKDFLKDEIEMFKKSGQKFILANLTTMQLDVYEEGIPVLSFPIQAKGRESSWWETPAGVYSIKVKSENHLSSIGRVYMPWSMQFQGNFFIHGIPYYPDGTPVSTSYSGGCIRLETADAKQVYALAERGTPIIVYEDATQVSETDRTYTFGPSGLSADSFLAADLVNGYTFASENTEAKHPGWITTNLLVGIVSAEYMDIERKITVESSDKITTNNPRLQVNQKYAVYDYLYVLLQESSQEALHVLARALGLSRTIDLITQKATAIGMKDSVFVDVNTSPSLNITTTDDTYQLLRYMYFNRRFLLTISANTAETRIYGAPAFADIQNNVLFKEDSQFVGAGVDPSTGSGYFVFDIKIGDATKPVAIIVHNSKDLKGDVQKLRTFVETSFR